MAQKSHDNSVSGRRGGPKGVGHSKIPGISYKKVQVPAANLKAISSIPELAGISKHNQQSSISSQKLQFEENPLFSRFSALIANLTRKQHQQLTKRLSSIGVDDFSTPAGN